jgi:hypothetical protein
MTAPIPSTQDDRRRQRSDDVTTALSYQLAWTRREAGLEALVLVDGQGCLIAEAGAPSLCEELAAFAPLLAQGEPSGGSAVDELLATMAGEVRVHKVAVDGAEAILCGRGGDARRAGALTQAISGCQRILADDAPRQA